MTDLYVAPTFLSLASMVAARRAGLYGSDARSTLVLANNAAIPEVQPGLDSLPGFAELAAGFDRVVSLNELIYPYHPRGYRTGAAEADGLREKLVDACGGEAPSSITFQSVHTRPSSMIADLFPDARLHVVSDGLMSYGPTRFELAPERVAQISRLLYLDLVSGVVPVLLSEHGLPSQAIPGPAFRSVLADFAESAGMAARTEEERPDAILLGQYLAALDLLTVEQEEELHRDMLRAAVARGARSIVFKPHPSAPPTFGQSIESLAAEHGVAVELVTDATPVELLYERWRPRAAYGCFSTGLATGHSVFGIDVFSLGTSEVARALPRFEDSNRVPLALTAAAHTRVSLGADGEATFTPPGDVDLQALVAELSHAMQPRDYPGRTADRRAELLDAHPELAVFFEPGSRATAAASVAASPKSVVDRVRILWYRTERNSPGAVRTVLRAARAVRVPLR